MRSIFIFNLFSKMGFTSYSCRILFYTSGGFFTAWSAKLTLQSEVQDQESRGGGRNIIPLTDLLKKLRRIPPIELVNQNSPYLTVHSLPSSNLPNSSGFTNFSHWKTHSSKEQLHLNQSNDRVLIDQS